MAKKYVFISYDYDNDRHYKNLLIAWDANRDFDFYMEDHSTDVSIDSSDAGTIKRAISSKINAATYFLCIIGKRTYQSRWVSWEISKAVELSKRLVAVKLDRENTTPNGLYGAGVSWAYSFSFDAIKSAIEDV